MSDSSTALDSLKTCKDKPQESPEAVTRQADKTDTCQSKSLFSTSLSFFPFPFSSPSQPPHMLFIRISIISASQGNYLAHYYAYVQFKVNCSDE